MTLFLLLFHAAGCSTEPEVLCLDPEVRDEPDTAVCEDAALYDATASIGTGETTFYAYAPLETMHPVAGPQGGHHFYAGVMVTGLNPGVKVYGDPLGCPVSIYDAVRADYTHTFPDDLMPPLVTTNIREMIGTPAESYFIGEYVYIDLYSLQKLYPDATELEVQASVTVTDMCGTTVEDSRPLLLSLYKIH